MVRRHERQGTDPPEYGSRRTWTPEDDHYLEVLLREAGYSLQEAAEWLERGVWAVRRRASMLGLPLRGDHLLPRQQKPRRLVECVRCGRLRPVQAREMCASCYAVTWKQRRRCKDERRRASEGGQNEA